ncbi:hypothetical protein [Mammaliicoccus sciuri]|uniref:hypothetical protein n=1 Tax=Mammaliicoccus sciuri TaxID=1296 RepID=UPI0021D3E329|nr:hypothetical protein [Mammaliicoccus sciuri]UXU70125.1 hypothetical protein MUA36_05450 [Mammaliicoccus sciuri]
MDKQANDLLIEIKKLNDLIAKSTIQMNTTGSISKGVYNSIQVRYRKIAKLLNVDVSEVIEILDKE